MTLFAAVIRALLFRTPFYRVLHSLSEKDEVSSISNGAFVIGYFFAIAASRLFESPYPSGNTLRKIQEV